VRRDPALRSLSSDHHLGLVIARRARVAAQEGAAARSIGWNEAKERFRAELDGHFRREECGLLPALRAAGEDALAERTLREHQAMRALIAEDRPENLALFAQLLATHIRFEEKVLFDTAQRRLGAGGLAALGGGSRTAREPPALYVRRVERRCFLRRHRSRLQPDAAALIILSPR